MSAGDEIIMPVTKPEAQALAEIHALRGLTDAVASLTRQVERMNAKVDDVRERVSKLEAREYERQIEVLSDRLTDAMKRVDALETTRDKQAGALGATGWAAKYGPWLFAIAAAAWPVSV